MIVDTYFSCFTNFKQDKIINLDIMLRFGEWLIPRCEIFTDAKIILYLRSGMLSTVFEVNYNFRRHSNRTNKLCFTTRSTISI